MTATDQAAGRAASSSSTGTAPALAQVARVLAAAGPRLAALLERAERRLEASASGHGAELGRHASATLAAGGKRLRPMLVFLCADPAGGEEDRLVQAAAAVELLHMATLVHDDVLDRASLRRGRPTVVESGGRPAATATGDLLFARAFAELVLTRHPEAIRVLSVASSALAAGELMQRADAWSDVVTPTRYVERCELKTARLFGAACSLGALLGGHDTQVAHKLGAFGRRIGVAFQMLDDVLDIAGPTERTGKPRGADLLDGTVTLPLILARRLDQGLADLDLRAAVTSPAAAEAICERIAATGALDAARQQALTRVMEAKEGLSRLALAEQQRSALDLVADGVVERYA